MTTNKKPHLLKYLGLALVYALIPAIFMGCFVFYKRINDPELYLSEHHTSIAFGSVYIFYTYFFAPTSLGLGFVLYLIKWYLWRKKEKAL